MIAGCYSLDLYCENYRGDVKFPDKHGHRYAEFPHGYTDELGSVCRRKAREAGWLLRRDGTALCPLCSPSAKKKQSTPTLPLMAAIGDDT